MDQESWEIHQNCVSDDCPFKHLAEGKSNTRNFQNVGGHKVCFSCGNIASTQWCSECKMTGYCRESESITVYHIGAHKCSLKQDTKIYRKQVRDAVLRNRGIGARGIQQAEMTLGKLGMHSEEPCNSPMLT